MNINLIQMANSLRNNPAQFLMQRGVQIPQNMTDPNEIINYLMRSGRISQAQYDNAVRMAQQFK